MPTDVERLAVLIEANTKQYERSMRRLEQRTDRAIRNSSKSVMTLNRAFAQAGAAARTFIGVFGAAFIAGGLSQAPRVLREIVSEVSNIGKVADKVGVSTEALQELRFAAELTGVSTSALDMGLQRFSRRIAEAAAGTGVLKDVLEANNIALRNTDGTMRSNEELLADYADLIRNAASEQDKLRLAFLAFDSEGAAVVNTLRNGRDGLADLRAEAHAAGGVFGDEMVRKMEDLDDQFARLSRTIEMGFKGAILSAVEQIRELVQQIDPELLDALRAFDEWVRQHNPQVLGGQAGEALRNILGLNKQGAATPGLHGEGLSPMAGIPALEGLGTSSFSGSLPGLDSLSGKPTKLAADEADKAAEKITSVVAALEAEYDALLMSAEAQELYNNLARAGVELESEAGQKIAESTLALQKKRKEVEDATDAQALLNDQTNYFGAVLTDAISSIVVHGDDASETMHRLAAAIADAALQAAILGQGPLAGLFGTAAAPGEVGGLIGLFAKGLAGKAHGGPVLGGQPILVGERRPEIFIPSTAGRIEPRPVMSGASGNQTQVVVNNYGRDEVNVNRRRTSRGELVEVMVGEVDKQMARGRFDDALGERTGGRPTQNNLVV